MLSTPFLTTATSRPLEERPEEGQGTLHVIFLQSPITHCSENLWAQNWCLSLLNPAQPLPDPHSQANNRSTNTGRWVYSCSEQYHVHPLAPGNFSAVKSRTQLQPAKIHWQLPLLNTYLFMRIRALYTSPVPKSITSFPSLTPSPSPSQTAGSARLETWMRQQSGPWHI